MIRVDECVGREGELKELSALVEAVAEHGVQVAAVTGEFGIGKSTLARRLVDEHRNRYGAERVLWAQAAPWETDCVGAVLSQLLQRGTARPETIIDDLAGRWSGDVPLLIVIDDAHCADLESMHAISGALSRHRTARVALILCAPAGEVPGIVGPLSELRLVGIDAAAIGHLARQRNMLLHPSMADRLHHHTAGNPRAAIALLDEAPSELWSRQDADLPAPGFVRDAVRARLEACSPAGRALIEAIAILGADEALSVAVELAAVEDEFKAADDAIATNMVDTPTDLEPGEARLQLRSDMIRAAVVGLMGLQAAGSAHRSAAELVTDPVRRLQHLIAATPGTDPELADEVNLLAQARAAEGAWSDAAQLLRRAARLTVDPLARDERLTRAVDALLAAGDCVGAGALVPAIESLRETPLRNATLAYMALLRGRPAEADVRLTRAWDIVNASRDPETAAMIAQRRVLDALIRCQGPELVDWADRAIDLAGRTSPSGVEAAAIRGLGVAWSGQPQQAMQIYRELSTTIRHGAQAQRMTMGRGWLELGLDDIDSARSSLEAGVSMASLGGSGRITLWALGWLARAHFLTGEWDSAVHTARRGLDLAATSGIVLATPLLQWTLAQVFSLRGDWASADRAIRDTTVGSTDYEIMRIPALLSRAQIAESAADYATVIHTLSPLIRLAKTTPGLREPGFWPWVDVLANALVIQGRLDDADALLQPHEATAAEREHRSARARLGYARGRLLGASGDIVSARRSFEAALELLADLPTRYDLARVNFAYGQTLRRAGKRRDADRVIGTARDLYLSLGADTYVQRCERELKAGGVHLPRGHRDEIELTPQEEAVTALVVRGMSNREVAAELFISPKTVQYHLTRIYAKLGLRSRSELTATRG
ncbi:helix-turn-helix transcriptional regulator [Aldersonia kunmingensis]|uniref:helix-turn-helix transcriptional regulator n=1 Tax=Aldersonia kunmingensis TaxID=408066 RepID=UPI00082BC7C6|nr:LuxR C-terminal-related transcriptional regulator [Aldersonia kunmingensis]